MEIVFLVVGLLIGFLVGWLFSKSKSTQNVDNAEVLAGLQQQILTEVKKN